MQHIREKPLPGTQINFAHPLAKGLVGCWLMNETGQRVFDSGPYKNHGVLSGFDSPPKRGTYGIAFDGVNDYVDAGNGASLKSQNFSIEFYHNTVSYTSVGYVGDQYSANKGWFIYSISQAQGIILALGNGTAFQYLILGIGNQPTNTWIHFSLTKNEKEIKTYINGVLKTNLTSNDATISFTTAPFLIGLTAGTQLNGSIDEVRIYNRALSQQEIAQLYLNPYDIFRED